MIRFFTITVILEHLRNSHFQIGIYFLSKTAWVVSIVLLQFQNLSSINGFTAILIDVDGDGSYSTTGSDRVIYWDMLKGNNYIICNFKTDAGAVVPAGTYKASATFLGRGPTNFPVYDVEQLDGVQTSAIRPFKKLNTSLYWDDTYISRWGDETDQGLMDETQQKQLVSTLKYPVFGRGILLCNM
jgi:hypothetical protein